MQHITANTARQDFDGILSSVIERSDTVSIATDKGAAILVSAEMWNELQRSKHNAAYYAMLDRSVKQAEDGRTVTKTLAELEELAQ